MENTPDIINKIEKCKETFYKEKIKNSIFTKGQKLDCALNISNNLDINILLKCSIFIKENTNKIYIHYPIIKTYLHPNNYQNVITHMISLTDQLSESHKSYEVHSDMKTFSMTAAQRYNDLIIFFLKKYFSEAAENNCLTKAYLYNSPNIIQLIQKMFSSFISEKSKNKIVIVK